jgi:hypothetical protein
MYITREEINSGAPNIFWRELKLARIVFTSRLIFSLLLLNVSEIAAALFSV